MSEELRAIIAADQMETIAREVIDNLVKVARERLGMNDRAGLFLQIQQSFADAEYNRPYVGACIAAAVIALAERDGAS